MNDDNTQLPPQAEHLDDIQFQEQIERIALYAALISGLLAAVMISIGADTTETVPLVGEGLSVATSVLIVGLMLSIVLTPSAYVLAGRHRNSQAPDTQQHDYVWSAIPVTLAVTVFVVLGIFVGFEFASRTYEGIEFDFISALFIVVVLTGLLSYVIFMTGAKITPVSLIYLAIGALMIALFLPGAEQENAYWWQRSFSYLGMTESNTASTLIFDFGMLFTGLLIIIWQYYFMDLFRFLVKQGMVTNRARRIIQIALILAGTGILLIGVVRYGMSPVTNFIHDFSATSTGVVGGLLMLAMYWLVPHYLRAFYAVSMVMALLIIAAVLLKVAGYFNLVGLELTVFTLLGLWVLLFYRNTRLLVSSVASP
jgi:hypothetical protein